jgi:hypothetical protein
MSALPYSGVNGNHSTPLLVYWTFPLPYRQFALDTAIPDVDITPEEVADAVWAYVIEGAHTAGDAMRLYLALLTGLLTKVDNLDGTTTITVRNALNTADRLVGILDNTTGARTSITTRDGTNGSPPATTANADVYAEEIWRYVLEGTHNADEVMRLLLSVLTGLKSVTDNLDGTFTMVYRSLDDSKNRISATQDEATGDRTAFATRDGT